jgi:hypothetical protein
MDGHLRPSSRFDSSLVCDRWRAVVSNVGIVAKSQSACICLSEQRTSAFGINGRDKDFHCAQAIDRQAVSLAQRFASNHRCNSR